VKATIKVTKDSVAKVLASVRTIAGSQVLVGVPASDAMRSDSPVDNATLGYIHEFGAPGANIPARPFLVPGVSDAMPHVIPRLRAAAKLATEGDSTAVGSGMHEAGLIAVNAVRAKIASGPFAPLKPSTVAARARRGRTGEMKPLIDTGKLLAAITYVIRRAK